MSGRGQLGEEVWPSVWRLGPVGWAVAAVRSAVGTGWADNWGCPLAVGTGWAGGCSCPFGGWDRLGGRLWEGHIDPAMTAALFVTWQIPLLRAMAYVIAQFLGSLVASAVLLGLFETNGSLPPALTSVPLH